MITKINPLPPNTLSYKQLMGKESLMSLWVLSTDIQNHFVSCTRSVLKETYHLDFGKLRI